MQVLFVILPIAIAMAGVAVAAFFWAARGGQFDDLDTPGHRAIFDDPATPPRAGEIPVGLAAQSGRKNPPHTKL